MRLKKRERKNFFEKVCYTRYGIPTNRALEETDRNLRWVGSVIGGYRRSRRYYCGSRAGSKVT